MQFDVFSFRRLLKLDEIFGSKDFYYTSIKQQKLDVNNLPPYFYPENSGNPYYPEGGWAGTLYDSSSGYKTGSQSSFYPALNNEYARYDVGKCISSLFSHRLLRKDFVQ